MKAGIASFEGKVKKFIYDGNNFFDASDRKEDTIELLNLKDNGGMDRLGDPEFFMPPLDSPGQIRDFYAFEEHAKNSRKTRGLEMLKEWYEIPVYYYTSNSSLYGSKMDVPYPSFTRRMDLEVELGFIIGKNGRNIRKEDALEFIAGVTIMNDWSARDIWITESKLNLGPSKSKDFATSMGPYITPIEEIMNFYDGKSFNIRVRSYINGQPFSDSNLNQIYWSIAELISHASMESNLRRGDVIMTGTFPGGCKFERNNGDQDWIKKGDLVRIESESIGVLENRVI